MPDAAHGVPVWRASVGAWSYGYSDDPGDLEDVATPGTWYPADEDSARSEVIAAAFAVRAIDSDSSRAHRDACARLTAAVTRLEEI